MMNENTARKKLAELRVFCFYLSPTLIVNSSMVENDCPCIVNGFSLISVTVAVIDLLFS